MQTKAKEIQLGTTLNSCIKISLKDFYGRTFSTLTKLRQNKTTFINNVPLDFERPRVFHLLILWGVIGHVWNQKYKRFGILVC